MKAPQVAGVVGGGLAVLVARLTEFGLESLWVSLLMAGTCSAVGLITLRLIGRLGDGEPSP